MPESRRSHNNSMQYASSDNIQEGIWRLKINDDDSHSQEEVVGQSGSPYPDRPGEPNCIYYLRTGTCGYGTNCRFNHPPYSAQGGLYGGELPERVGEPDCVFYLKTGTCKYGPSCKYHHPRDRHGAGPVSFNILGLPMREEEKSCPYYMRTGFCKFGPACKFHHPPPTAHGTSLPISGSAAFGSLIVPASSLPYVGSLPEWQLPRATYISSPQIHGSQAYIPLVVPPSTGIIPAQGWNSYLGNMSPGSSTSILGSSLVYNSNLAESGSSVSLQLLSTSFTNLPERPDKPECRHFMHNGSCKHGSECKYNHPKERISQLAVNSIGPYCLPLRPGQAVCSSYNLYGICKYGPTCKFDHPPPPGAYSYDYGLNLPPLHIHDYYPRNSPMAISSETSPSNSKLSENPDWIRNSDTISSQNQNGETKMQQTSHKELGSPPNPTQTLSQLHDRADD